MNYSKRTEPSRSLFDPNKETQHQWTNSASTDLRAKFQALKVEARLSANVAPIRRKAK